MKIDEDWDEIKVHLNGLCIKDHYLKNVWRRENTYKLKQKYLILSKGKRDPMYYI